MRQHELQDSCKEGQWIAYLSPDFEFASSESEFCDPVD